MRRHGPTLRGLLLGALLILATVRVGHADEAFTAEDTRQAIHQAAEAYGVSERRLFATTLCESRLDPNAVGDHRTSLGPIQLSALSTGLLGHFYAQGYDNPFDPYQAEDYLARVLAGEFAAQGIGLWRWSCG